jgi:hypothetical protein
MRFVLVHIHIFKNAGSSVDLALSVTFGNGFVDLHKTQISREIVSNSHKLREYLIQN